MSNNFPEKLGNSSGNDIRIHDPESNISAVNSGWQSPLVVSILNILAGTGECSVTVLKEQSTWEFIKIDAIRNCLGISRTNVATSDKFVDTHSLKFSWDETIKSFSMVIEKHAVTMLIQVNQMGKGEVKSPSGCSLQGMTKISQAITGARP
jgi:hypothetical protein